MSRIEYLACQIANDWRAARGSAYIGKMDQYLFRRLEELDKLTQGDARRCLCIAGRDSGGLHHGHQCPAFQFTKE